MHARGVWKVVDHSRSKMHETYSMTPVGDWARTEPRTLGSTDECFTTEIISSYILSVCVGGGGGEGQWLRKIALPLKWYATHAHILNTR